MNWLRPLLMMFYAPTRGMSEVRDRSPLAPAMLLALLAQIGYAFCTQWRFLNPAILRAPSILWAILFESLIPILFLAVVFVPAMALLANLFERRASFGLIIQQEYASLAATTFYAWAAANIAAIPLARAPRIAIERPTTPPIIARIPAIGTAMRRQTMPSIANKKITAPRINTLVHTTAVVCASVLTRWRLKPQPQTRP